MKIQTDLVREAIVDAVVHTMEEQAFMDFVLLDDAEPFNRTADLAWARIRVGNPVDGAMAVLCPMQLADRIIKTVSGVTHEVGEADEIGEAEPGSAFVETEPSKELIDTVAEITNTVVGRTMANLVQDNAMFEIGLPESGVGAPPENSEVLEMVFDYDGTRLAVLVELGGIS